MKFAVYRILNRLNGKVYIGSSSVIDRRLYEHRRSLNRGTHKNRHLQSAWAEYGEHNFELTIIGRAVTLAEILRVEKHLIIAHRSHEREFGYNVSTNPDNSKLGVKLTPEQCARVGAAKIGNKNRLGQTFTSEVRTQISAKLKGRKLSAETKAKMSAARRGVPKSPEHIAKIHTSRKRTMLARRLAAPVG